MNPVPLDAATSERMRGQRTRGTGPELALRAALRYLGATGYRCQWPLPLEGRPRTADLAWPGRRLAVFVDGCFWHGCPDHLCPTRNNRSWWAAKAAGNRTRDAATTEQLAALGWDVVRVWEHEHPREAAARVLEVLTGTAVQAARPPT